MTTNPPTHSRTLTVAEFMRMAEDGLFENFRGERYELIDGEIDVMSPQGNRHFTYLDFAAGLLRDIFEPVDWVRAQATMYLLGHSAVDPDIAVIAGSRADNFARLGNDNPTTALLVVESSNTTLRKDRGRKASLYAAAGILDYWILDVNARLLEVRRDPQPDPAAEFGMSYASLTVLAPGQTVSPLARPAAVIAVADMMPA